MSWTIYSKNACPFCVKAKEFLKIKGIEFTEKNIDESPMLKEELLNAVPGARTVPQIFHGDTLVGGFDKLEAYFLSQAL